MSIEGEAADGRRFVGLYRPFKVAGFLVKEVTFQPVTYGHLVSWQSGQYQNANQLLLDLSGLTLAQLYGLRRPDDQRVMTAFMEHVHPGIRADIDAGIIPIADASTAPIPRPPAAYDASPAPAAGSFADRALRAADAAEARTPAQEAEELRLSMLGEDPDDLDQPAAPGYSGAFGGDPAT